MALIHLITGLYFTGLRLLSPFHRKAAAMVRAQKDIHLRYAGVFPVNREIIWFHVSSLGEFEQGRPLMEAWKKYRPDAFILLTFFSPSGYEIRKDYSFADYVDYLPFDSSRRLGDIVRLVQPNALVLVRYDIWPRLLSVMSEIGAPVYLVSAVFRSNSFLFNPFGTPLLRMIGQMAGIFVQDEASAELLKSRGITQVTVAGDTRADRVLALAERGERMENISAFTGGHPVVIAGSSWEPEEKMLQRYLSEEQNIHFKLIIAPHDVSENHLQQIERLFKDQTLRLEDFLKNPTSGGEKRVLLIDRIGLLTRLYHEGTVAVVGGGFGKGIHNLLEPAAFGLPVLFGPRHHKFPEAKILLEREAGFCFNNYSGFKRMLSKLLFNKNLLMTASKASSDFVKSEGGATSLIISCLLENT